MKFIHLSDLHLGKRVNEFPMLEDQQYILTEILQIIDRIREFHGRAYGWSPEISPESMIRATGSGGFLLRTKLRAAIELLDQLFQYHEAGGIRVDELGKESYETEVPSLEELGDD